MNVDKREYINPDTLNHCALRNISSLGHAAALEFLLFSKTRSTLASRWAGDRVTIVGSNPQHLQSEIYRQAIADWEDMTAKVSAELAKIRRDDAQVTEPE